MENKQPNYPAMLQVINIIHGALLFFPLVFAGVAVYINETSPMASDDLSFLSYASIGLLIVAFPVSAILFKSTVKNSQIEQKALPQKIATFQTAHLIRMAMFESAGLFAAVATLQTGNYYNLGVLLIVLIMFFFLRPTPAKIAMDLGLSTDEKQQLANS